MSYAILRVAKIKTGSGIKSTQIHNLREREIGNEYGNKDINLELTQNNFEILNNVAIEPRKVDYRANIEQNIAKYRISERAVRKDAIKSIEVLTTSDNEFFENMKKEEIQDFFKHSQKFLEKKYGKEHIIQSIVHLDEATPHMHTTIVPIKDNCLSAKKVLGSKMDFIKLQNNYHSHMIEKYELDRGISKSKSNRQHLNVEDYKKQQEIENKRYFELNEEIEKSNLKINKNKEQIQDLNYLKKEQKSLFKSQSYKNTEEVIKKLYATNYKISQEINKKYDEIKSLNIKKYFIENLKTKDVVVNENLLILENKQKKFKNNLKNKKIEIEKKENFLNKKEHNLYGVANKLEKFELELKEKEKIYKNEKDIKLQNKELALNKYQKNIEIKIKELEERENKIVDVEKLIRNEIKKTKQEYLQELKNKEYIYIKEFKENIANSEYTLLNKKIEELSIEQNKTVDKNNVIKDIKKWKMLRDNIQKIKKEKENIIGLDLKPKKLMKFLEKNNLVEKLNNYKYKLKQEKILELEKEQNRSFGMSR